MNISVLLATFNRDDTLQKTLAGYTQQDTDVSTFEIVVVDNACLKSTQNLVDKMKKTGLNITYTSCSKAGKNASLNKGLSLLRGELVVLTDDDAIPSPHLISSYREAANKYDNINIFGGAISPTGKALPRWVNVKNSYMQGAYVIRPTTNQDEFVKPTYIWGPNMAVRKHIFESGFHFNEDIGPNGNNYIMGSETEFLSRLQAASYDAVFLSSALVFHQIRPEQVSLTWLLGRASRQGKGLARHILADQNTTNLHQSKLQIKQVKQAQKQELLKGLLTLDKGRIISALYVLKLKKAELDFIEKSKVSH